MAKRAGQSGLLASYRRKGTGWGFYLRNLLYLVIFWLVATVVLALPFPPAGGLQLQEGDVSPTDVRAPRRFSFISQVLTEQARQRAEDAVQDIYDPPQARIARQQMERARAVLNFVDMVRTDPFASTARKSEWLGSIADVNLSPEAIKALLMMDDRTWKDVSAEIINVLDRAMREEIRSSNLEAVKRTVPALVSPQFTEEQNLVISQFVQGLLRPNAFFNAEKTAEARRKARESVQPITRTFEEGEIIVRAGEIVDALDVEALEALGLQQERVGWNDILGAGGFALLCSVWLGLYMVRHLPLLRAHPRYSTLLFVLLVTFTILLKVMVPGQTMLAYMFPVAALAFLITVLVEFPIALGAVLVISLLAGYLSRGSLELMVYLLLSGLFAGLVLARSEKLSAFFWAGLFVSVVNVAIILIFQLPANVYDPLGLLGVVSMGFVNGLLSAGITLATFYFLGSVFGITTTLQLMELLRPTHPLLRELLLKAPGTYHHSILVSNMAEEAASRIGADTLLTRVGAYYHDIGKIKRPYFFAENQVDGVNVHEGLDPLTSADIIRRHVEEGLELAREYKLPPAIQAFIPEHHGTTVASYFYHLAKEKAADPSQVNEDDFRYPGPKPQSRETAIVMLADGCESAVRSKRPTSPEQIDEIVYKMIRSRLLDGQLDECNLTMRDLQTIREAFVAMLAAVFHPRIQYPEPATAPPPEEPAAPAPAGIPSQERPS